MKKISSIDNQGKVLFVDEKGTGTTEGTKADCLAYGFKFRNDACYCYETVTKPANDKNMPKGNVLSGAGNFVLGVGNRITSGAHNVALGFKNLIKRDAQNAIAIGKNAYAESFGEFAYSCSRIENRAKYSVYQYDGITTDDTRTELYLGGHDNVRFNINTDYESAYAIDYSAVALNAVDNQIWTEYGRCTYKYCNSTLTEVGHQKGTTIRDSALDYVCDFAPHTHEGVHISVDVTGEAGHTVYWNVTLRITEVRYG